MYSHEYQDAVLASDLSAQAKLVALAISYHYNWKKAIESFPSISKLVQRTSLSKATICRAKNELVSRGYLVSTRRFNDSNLYLPVIPSQSQTETLVVSEGVTNYEYNYEVNYEKKAASAALGIINNIDQEGIWKVFDNEERYTRPRPAGRSNKNSRRINKETRRNNPSSEELAGFHQDLITSRETDWLG